MNPTLHFDFIDDQGNKQPFLFENPKNIIIAETIDEIVPSLEKVQNAVDQGYYAAGYISYEAAPAFDPDFKVHKNNLMPLLWFGIFKEPALESLVGGKKFHTTDWVTQTRLDEYHQHMKSIKKESENGDTYQINYTIRMLYNFRGDPKSYYNHLAKKQTANYSAYLNIGHFSILYVSPELFF